MVPLRREEPQGDDWRDDPRTGRLSLVADEDGCLQSVELFTIGALAKALYKTTGTIRRWIVDGVIPDSGLKTSAIPGPLGNAGRRLWTEDQIVAPVRIATEERVIGPVRAREMSETNLAERIRAVWLQNNW